jgi:hypothetical protein
VLTTILVLGRMERATDVQRSGPFMTVAIGLFGIASLLACHILIRRYVAPAMGFPSGYSATLTASALVSSLVVVPTMCILQRAKATSGLLSWGVSLCAAIFVVIIARTGFNVLEVGSEKAEQSKARSAEVEQIIDQPNFIEHKDGR